MIPLAVTRADRDYDRAVFLIDRLDSASGSKRPKRPARRVKLVV
jgi:hypothetical protein